MASKQSSHQNSQHIEHKHHESHMPHHHDLAMDDESMHSEHMADFRKRFWASLILTVSILYKEHLDAIGKVKIV